MKTNDLAALRMRFAPGEGERPGSNPVLMLCAEVEQLRSDAAVQAIVVSGLGEKLAEARETNAALATEVESLLKENVALSNECVEVAESFGNEDTNGGESLGDYVARRMAHGAGLVRQFDGGGLTTGQRMELMRELHQFFAAALNAPVSDRERLTHFIETLRAKIDKSQNVALTDGEEERP